MPATLYVDTANLEARLPLGHMLAAYVWGLAGPAPAASPAHLAFEEASDLSRTPAERLAAARRMAAAMGFDLSALLASRNFEYMTEEELRITRASGIDVQLHTHNHTIHDMSRQAIELELDANAAVLSRVLGLSRPELRHFCYPSGLAAPRAARVLEAMGIASATTLEQRLAFKGSDPCLLPRILDGSDKSSLEFEAELSGFAHILRTGLGHVRWWRRAPRANAAAEPAAVS